jgi:hypothetical protein
MVESDRLLERRLDSLCGVGQKERIAVRGRMHDASVPL